MSQFRSILLASRDKSVLASLRLRQEPSKLRSLPRFGQQWVVLKCLEGTVVLLDRAFHHPPTNFRLITENQKCSTVIAWFGIRDLRKRSFGFTREAIEIAA